MKTFCLMAAFWAALFLTPAAADDAADSYAGLADRILPAVVTVIVYGYDGSLKQIGSGFFYSDTAQIMTSSHVLTPNTRAEIRTRSGKKHRVGSILERNDKTDIARARIQMPAPTPFLPVAARPPAVGDRIIVAGAPMGLEHTFTEGIVSAWRTIPEKGRVLQISAPISPGSSGGPVLNLAGEVVGIAAFQMIKGQNLNFAVPITPAASKATPGAETRKLNFYTDKDGVLIIE
jgi:serine protease Do